MTSPILDAIATAKAATVYAAHSNSDIDGHGDEGAGYDYDVFAAGLEAAGWTYQPKGLVAWVIGHKSNDEWTTLAVSFDGEENAAEIMAFIEAEVQTVRDHPINYQYKGPNRLAEMRALVDVTLTIEKVTAFSMHTLPQPSRSVLEEAIDNEWTSEGNRKSILFDIARGLTDKGIVSQTGPGQGARGLMIALFDSIWTEPEGDNVDWDSRPGRSEYVRLFAEAILASEALHANHVRVPSGSAV